MDDLERRFKEASSELIRLINKRQRSWKLTSVMEFEDVSSEILAYIWKNFASYDPTRPLDRWANTIITSQMRNLLRDRHYKHARPCVAANCYGKQCAYNAGGDRCSFTKSGEQDSSCKFFAKWLAKKQGKFAVSTPLSMEAHVNEVYSKQSNFMDYESGKKVIDEKIIPLLNKEEAKIYQLLYIKNLSEKEVGRRMGYPAQKNSKVRGYLKIRTAILRFYELGKKILDEEGIYS